MELMIPITALDSDTVNRIRELGYIELTEQAKDLLDESQTELVDLFKRYANADYGEADDPFRNDLALYAKHGVCRGIYVLSSGQRVAITTKFNQAVTQIQDAEELEL